MEKVLTMGFLNSFWQFLHTIPWWAWIPIVAIVCGTITRLVAMSHKHHERMEMIRHGIDPRNRP